ncbi:MAG: hypothetical protein E7320_11745 [Clostridiales bacterium]|nr:hypothetical protein [Clostridiales bacterium]
MKKFLSVLLVLALLVLPVVSMAEAAETTDDFFANYETYTHTNDQYSLFYPKTWTVLNADMIETIMTSMTDSQDEQLAQLAAQYGPQIKQTDMVMFISETGMTNVNVVCQTVGLSIDEDQLLLLAPSFTAELAKVMEGIEFINEGTIMDLATCKAMLLEYNYTLAGVEMYGAQAYVPVGEDMYIFTYNCSDAGEINTTAEDFGVMLGGFVAQ